MGGTYKKKLRAEKAKVKLKGAKLPKGLNVTKTEFKVRKIKIPEQIKNWQKHDDGNTLPPIDLKQLLNRLKHHNTNVRMETLRRLEEVILGGDQKIVTHLNELVQSVAAICLDVEREIRRESFKVLNYLLNAFHSDTMAPFFNIISSYLRCAMTHIRPAIQEDSLLMLDVLLHHLPELIAKDNSKIFQNFLEMISRARIENGQIGRTLTVNMGSKQTTVKWRSKVLQRLNHMLRLVDEYNSRCSLGHRRDTLSVTKVFNKTNVSEYYTLLRAPNYHLMDLTEVFCKSVGKSSSNCAFLGDRNAPGYDRKLLCHYISHLMPLLMESWLEVSPQTAEQNENSATVLTDEAAVTLKLVLEIMDNLWTMVDHHDDEFNNKELSCWFQLQYAQAFAAHFPSASFPYQRKEKLTLKENPNGKTSNRKQKVSKTNLLEQYCCQENISLIYIIHRFFEHHVHEEAKRFQDYLNYLQMIVANMDFSSQDSCMYLEKVLKLILHRNGRDILKQDKTGACTLLRNVIELFLTNGFHNKALSYKILLLICDILQDARLSSAYGDEEFNGFLNHLPQLLLRPTITQQVLMSMSTLAKQRNVIFLEALLQSLPLVIKNLDKIQVQGSASNFEGVKHILNLFYWLKYYRIDLNLMEALNDHVTDKRIIAYCKIIIE